MLGNPLISLQFEVPLSGEGTVRTLVRFVSPFCCFHHSWVTVTLTYHTGKHLPKSSIFCGFSKVLALAWSHHFIMDFINWFLFSSIYKKYIARGWFGGVVYVVEYCPRGKKNPGTISKPNTLMLGPSNGSYRSQQCWGWGGGHKGFIICF